MAACRTASVVIETLEDRRLLSASISPAADKVSGALLQQYAADSSATIAIDATAVSNADRLFAQLKAVGLTGGARFHNMVSGFFPVDANRSAIGSQATQVR